MLRKLSSIPEKRLAMYGVATGAALAAGLPSQADATPVTLDLRGLSSSVRTASFAAGNATLYFDVNAPSAAAAVAFSSRPQDDFSLVNPTSTLAAVAGRANGVNGIAAGTYKGSPQKAFLFAASNSVHPDSNFAQSANLNPGLFFPGKTSSIGLRFDISGSTHYGWANLTIGSDSSITLNALGYETNADTAIHVPSLVPDRGSSLALLAIGAAGLLAFRSRQRKTA